MIKRGRDFFRHAACSLTLCCSDVLALTMSFALGYFFRAWVFAEIIPVFPPMQHSVWVYWGMWPLFLFVILLFAYGGLYPSIGMSFWEETKAVTKYTSVSFIAVVVMTFVAKTSVNFSRTVVVMALMISLVTLPAMRRITRYFLGRAGLWKKTVVLIGTQQAVSQVLCNLGKHPDWGYIPAGAVLPDGEDAPEGLSHLGRISHMNSLNLRVDETIVTMPQLSREELVSVVESATRFAPVVKVMADLYGLASAGVKTHDLDGMLLLEMQYRLYRSENRLLKRGFDLLLSAVSLVVLSPVLVLTALLVKLDSPGPVLFGHTRVGRDGSRFTCYKFRTMVPDAQERLAALLENDPQARRQWDRDFKLKSDPRVTRVGKFLRKTSLDELPQIWNVLKGEMSFIGPRPIVPEEVERYGDKARYLFRVTPGITGLWQVSGRNDIDYSERVLLDEYYAKNWSLWLDIEILLRTVGAVFRRNGAY